MLSEDAPARGVPGCPFDSPVGGTTTDDQLRGSFQGGVSFQEGKMRRPAEMQLYGDSGKLCGCPL